MLFRRNAFQPFGPDSLSTPPSHKRLPPAHRPAARNHSPLPQPFPKKPLQQWSRFGDPKRALLDGPPRRGEHRSWSASGRADPPGRESRRPKAHRIQTWRDGAWPMPCPRSANDEQTIHPGVPSASTEIHLFPKEDEDFSFTCRRSRASSSLPWFPGNPKQENRGAGKSIKATPSSMPHRDPAGPKSATDRSQCPKTFPPNPDDAPRRVHHDGSDTIPVRSPESPPKRRTSFPNQDRSKRQSSPLGSLVTIQHTHSGSPLPNLHE
jgi:hypothetical protein